MTKSTSSKPRKTVKKPGRTKAAPSQPLVSLTLDQKLDILGVLMVGVAAVTILSMLSNTQGAITGQFITWLRQTFGLGVYVVPVVIGLIGLWLLLRSFERTPRLSGEQSAGFLLFFLLSLMTLAWLNRDSGGTLGAGLATWLIGAVGASGSIVVLIVGWLIAIVLLFDLAPSEIAAWLGRLLSHFKRALRPSIAGGSIVPGQPVDMMINPRGKAANNGGSSPARSFGGDPDDVPNPFGALNGTPTATATPLPGEAAKPSTRVSARARPVAPPPGMLGDATMANPLAHASAPARAPAADATNEPAPATGPIYSPRIIGSTQPWELPKIEAIYEPGAEASMSEDDLRDKAHIIEDTLRAFGVEGKVIEVNRGPAITQFGVEPGFITRAGKQTKVKVSKISALADDLALALAAKSIRIEAPVPGRAIVGIEVPNGEIATVCIRDVLESESFTKIKSPLRIALGQDVSGQAVAGDLGSMPHLLIAGTTGSGKSVCVNAIITCLMTNNTPDELKFLMVDPKRVELTTYNGVPHLIAPVVVDLEKVVGVLNWVTREMDERYRKFARSGARNIDDYNTKIEESNLKVGTPGSGATREPRLPYIVVVIDELADLMMLAPDETEKTICRLAQMARATGIHLIIATQRPSVDVVTGLIKANFPARIAFSVASSVDSRVILDTTGAERLLGRGDMLYVAPEVGSPQRLQGCYVSDREIHKLVRYWKGLRGTDQAPSGADVPIEAAPTRQTALFDSVQAEIDQANANGEDDLLQRAIDVVRVQKKASISLLQRQLRIGYTRAARLIDQMEEKGIVGPATQDSRWREVLINVDLN
jgi:S-DNA-T family DNA segregation ATPase FtsK/SpoIIIE